MPTNRAKSLNAIILINSKSSNIKYIKDIRIKKILKMYFC